MPVDIPIKAAEDIAKKYGYEQVIIYARHCNAGREHMTTYGINKDHCGAAARIGQFLQNVIMKWNKEYDED